MSANNEHTYFINQLYRDFLLPTILGKDNAEILYWAGKRISHQFQLDNKEDLASFFENTNFGTLTLKKEKKGRLIFELSGPVVADRLSANSSEFALETGIIAETLAIQTGQFVEATYEVDKNNNVLIEAQVSEI